MCSDDSEANNSDKNSVIVTSPNSTKQERQLEQHNKRFLNVFMSISESYLQNVEEFLQMLQSEDDERYLLDLLGPKVKLITAEHSLFVLTLAQICFKARHVSLSRKALALDLRMMILNNEMGEFQSLVHDYIIDESVLRPYRLQLLPYLKSFYVFFKQIMAEQCYDPDIGKYFFKIWSVINYLATIRESDNY